MCRVECAWICMRITSIHKHVCVYVCMCACMSAKEKAELLHLNCLGTERIFEGQKAQEALMLCLLMSSSVLLPATLIFARHLAPEW